MGADDLKIIILVLLLSIPLFVSAKCVTCHQAHYSEINDCTYCHNGISQTKRKDIAHHELISGIYARYRIPKHPQILAGRRHIESARCRRCHHIGGKGNVVSVDMDRRIQSMAPEKAKEGILKPNDYMPEFGFTNTATESVVLSLMAYGADAKHTNDVEMVHFSENTKDDLFQQKCGACHRLLSPKEGPVGTGDIGPNLSGLLTEFYMINQEKPWDKDKLLKWIQNPRKIRSQAVMQPVKLPQKEQQLILHYFE